MASTFSSINLHVEADVQYNFYTSEQPLCSRLLQFHLLLLGLWLDLPSNVLIPKFSVGLRSGDSAGVFHHFLFSSMNSFVCRDVCFRSLSRMNLCPSGYTSSKKGQVFYLKSWCIKDHSSSLQKCRWVCCPASLL